jgi:uncharacterized lipoprotein YddW (UPF0748 family)
MIPALVCTVLLAFLGPQGCALSETSEDAPATARTAAPEMQGIWVTRWDYRSAADVRRIMQEVEDLGATDVFWQVRGQCDAFYRSDIEPWGRELFLDLPDGASTPGYDPLTMAVDEAHDRGLKIHAWFNVFPMWKGKDAPKDPRHVFNAHPEWRLRDKEGKAQALNEGYVILNPGLPEVQDHVVRVASDIVQRYDVDGLHLDYVRFVSEGISEKGRFPSDPESMRRLRAAMGATDETPAPALVRDWIRVSITQVVRRIRSEAIIMRSGVEFSAAVWRNPDLGREAYLQDAALWLADGTLDRVLPMIYFDNNDKYKADLDAWLAVAEKSRVTPGIAAYKHTDPQMTIQQIKLSKRAGGYAVFAYASLFESVDPTQPKDLESINMRSARRAAVSRYQR